MKFDFWGEHPSRVWFLGVPPSHARETRALPFDRAVCPAVAYQVKMLPDPSVLEKAVRTSKLQHLLTVVFVGPASDALDIFFG